MLLSHNTNRSSSSSGGRARILHACLQQQHYCCCCCCCVGFGLQRGCLFLLLLLPLVSRTRLLQERCYCCDDAAGFLAKFTFCCDILRYFPTFGKLLDTPVIMYDACMKMRSTPPPSPKAHRPPGPIAPAGSPPRYIVAAPHPPSRRTIPRYYSLSYVLFV